MTSFYERPLTPLIRNLHTIITPVIVVLMVSEDANAVQASVPINFHAGCVTYVDVAASSSYDDGTCGGHNDEASGGHSDKASGTDVESSSEIELVLPIDAEDEKVADEKLTKLNIVGKFDDLVRA